MQGWRRDCPAYAIATLFQKHEIRICQDRTPQFLQIFNGAIYCIALETVHLLVESHKCDCQQIWKNRLSYQQCWIP